MTSSHQATVLDELPPPRRQPQAQAQPHRFYLLDALRGILALLVAYRHAPPYLRVLRPTEDSFLAVDFFLCLSGFVLAFAYRDRLRDQLTVRNFLVGRFVRLYPTFFISTLLAFAFALGPGHLLAQGGGRALAVASLPSFFLLPCLPLAPSFLLFPLNMACWTLLLELGINIGYALLLRSKLTLGAIGWTLGAVCLICWSVLACTAHELDSGSTWPGLTVGLARVGLSFSLGALVLDLWKTLPQGKLRRPRGLLFACGLVTILLAVVLIPTPLSGHRAYQLGVITVVLPVLIFFGADIHLGRLPRKACAVLGELSYALYLLHLPLLTPLFGARVAHLASSSTLAARFLLPAYLVVLAAASWGIRVYVDIPLGRALKRRYMMRKSAAHPVSTLARGPQLVQS